MSWIGPDQCEEHCCGPPTPCPPPTIKCKRYEAGYDGYGYAGRFHYEITNAVSAYIRVTCPDGYGGTTVTTTDLDVGDDRAVSGDVNTSPDCFYCVVAVNECGSVDCCDACDEISCELTIERHRDTTVAAESYDYVEISWLFGTLTPLGSLVSIAEGYDQVTSATLNGVDVYITSVPGAGFTGFIRVTDPDELPDFYELVITSDCGKTKTCRVDVPCCWRVKKLRVTFALGDASASCDRADLGTINGVQYHSVTDEFQMTGLGAINGTHFFDTAWFTCNIKPTLRTLGTFTVRHRGIIDATELGVRQVNEFIYEWTVTVQCNGTALFFSVPSGEVYFYRKRDAVVLVDGMRCACSFLLTGVPPCSAACINAITGIPAFIGAFSATNQFNFNAACGTVQSSDFRVTHRHPSMGLIKLGGTAGACDPLFPVTNANAVVPVTTIPNAVSTEFI
jgi:hypothetical protein